MGLWMEVRTRKERENAGKGLGSGRGGGRVAVILEGGQAGLAERLVR